MNGTRSVKRWLQFKHHIKGCAVVLSVVILYNDKSALFAMSYTCEVWMYCFIVSLHDVWWIHWSNYVFDVKVRSSGSFFYGVDITEIDSVKCWFTARVGYGTCRVIRLKVISNKITNTKFLKNMLGVTSSDL